MTAATQADPCPPHLPGSGAHTPDPPPADAPPSVLLASTSPRRRLLLQEAGIRFHYVDPRLDDAPLRPLAGVHPGAWVQALAYLKARSAWGRLGTAERSLAPVVLGADTVVHTAGRIVSAPADADEALEMLRSHVNAEHEVYSGVALVCVRTGRRDLFADRAVVRWGDPGEESIGSYVSSGAWAGKAGGYNLIERLEAGWPIECVGDPSTVMGLPVRGLAERLSRFVASG